MTSLAAIALAVLLTLAGRRLAGPALVGTSPFRLAVSALAGMIALHLVATLLDLLGIRWGVLSLGLPLLALAVVSPWKPDPASSPANGLRSALGWGDAVAGLALLAFTLLALSLWITAPDFVYHWGIKGHRFALAHGIDYAWLGRPWNWVLHPDYPNLLPELFATTALIARRFGERGQMLWSTWFFLLILFAVREAFEQSRVERWMAQAGLAVTAAALATFGIGHQMAGAADWMPALALAAALPTLLRPPDRAGDLQIGIAAAFAAASKVEGVALGALLVLIQLVRRPSPETVRRFAARRPLALALPMAAVVLPWLVQTFRHGLYQAFNSGSFDPGRARIVLPALADALATRGWHGLSAALLLIPLLFLSRRTRPVAWVTALQLGFYLWVYFTAAVDTRHQVISSFPRLALHLVPALLAAAVVALDGVGKFPPSPDVVNREAPEALYKENL
jgi:hypothetical protein